MIQSFRDLEVWKKGMALAIRVYRVSEDLPRREIYGLTSQVRRSAVSIPSNVAEGKALGGKGYRRNIKIAMGSEAELQTQLELTKELGLLDGERVAALLLQTSEVGRMLAGLYRALPRK